MTRYNQLNDAKARSNKLPPGYHLDGRGLYLQIGPNGGRSWIFRFKLNGRDREMGLGSIQDLGVAAAREAAQLVRATVKQGFDPIAQRRDARGVIAETVKAAYVTELLGKKTFQICATEYIKQQADEWKNAKHHSQWTNTLRDYAYPHFGPVTVRDITKAQIVDALRPVWKKKAETASRVLQRVRTVMNFAAANDYCTGFDAEFWRQVKMALGSNERARKSEHHASCAYRDAPALPAKVLASTATPMVKLAFEFGVLTAARSGEIRGAAWSEIDEKSAQWIIPAERMKASREHRVPLSARALEILAEARKHALELNGKVESLIFCSPKGKSYSDMTFTQLLRRLELPYTMHGFRATFRTWGMETTTHSHEMLEFALAHVAGDQTVRAYARGDMGTKRQQLMAEWAAYMTQPGQNGNGRSADS